MLRAGHETKRRRNSSHAHTNTERIFSSVCLWPNKISVRTHRQQYRFFSPYKYIVKNTVFFLVFGNRFPRPRPIVSNPKMQLFASGRRNGIIKNNNVIYYYYHNEKNV